MQTEDPGNQMNDIKKGKVSTGWVVRTVQYSTVSVCMCLLWCGGVMRVTNTQISQQYCHILEELLLQMGL
jgi:hypothetical protein